MKIILFFMVFLINTFSFSQDLNPNALALKENLTPTYNAIRDFAVKEWEDDHFMVIAEINRQADALKKIMSYYEDDEKTKIMIKAIREWSKNRTIDWDNIFESTYIDWYMVVKETEMQLKAKSKY